MYRDYSAEKYFKASKKVVLSFNENAISVVTSNNFIQFLSDSQEFEMSDIYFQGPEYTESSTFRT